MYKMNKKQTIEKLEHQILVSVNEYEKVLEELTMEEQDELFIPIVKEYIKSEGYGDLKSLYYKIESEGQSYFYEHYTYFPTTVSMYNKICEWMGKKVL